MIRLSVFSQWEDPLSLLLTWRIGTFLSKSPPAADSGASGNRKKNSEDKESQNSSSQGMERYALFQLAYLVKPTVASKKRYMKQSTVSDCDIWDLSPLVRLVVSRQIYQKKSDGNIFLKNVKSLDVTVLNVYLSLSRIATYMRWFHFCHVRCAHIYFLKNVKFTWNVKTFEYLKI